uniref:MRP-S28 domain-containing protein n=1 Tax=Steinernema glaseri TaxID=37863 RepID=A0A1I7ZZ56_9BILA
MTGRAEVEKISRFDLSDRLSVRRPRHEDMPTDQDWPSVWPTAASFKASVVPLPVRMGSRPNPDRRPPFKKVGNLELVKIPNFLHLTPEAIERQCNAIKKFCTPWPKELKEVPELADKYLPMHISYSDYVHQGTSLRDGRARVCTVTLKLADLKLSKHAREKFIRLVGNRYDEASDVLTIVTDRCPTRKQNRDYASYLLTVLYREAQKREAWEEMAERTDDLKVHFEGSEGEKHLKEIIEKSDGLEDLKEGDLSENPKIRKFAETWYKYRNEKETVESARSYANSVRELLGIQSLEEKCRNAQSK